MTRDNFCIQVDAVLSTSNFGQFCIDVVHNVYVERQQNVSQFYDRYCPLFEVQYLAARCTICD